MQNMNILTELNIQDISSYMKDFLKTLQLEWDETFVNPEERGFLKANYNNFFDGKFKAIYVKDLTTGNLNMQIVKATPVGLKFYVFIEDRLLINKLDQFHVSKDLERPFQLYMLGTYREKFIDYVEKLKNYALAFYQYTNNETDHENAIFLESVYNDIKEEYAGQLNLEQQMREKEKQRAKDEELAMIEAELAYEEYMESLHPTPYDEYPYNPDDETDYEDYGFEEIDNDDDNDLDL